MALSSYFVYKQRDDLAILLSVRWWDIVKLLGIMLLYEFVSAARFASLYKALGAEVGNLESLGLSKLANALNVMLPAQAGGIARAVYLKSRYNLPYSQTPVVFLGSIVVSMSMGASIIILFNIFNVLMGHPVPPVLWLGGVASISVLLLWLTIPKWMILRLGRMGKILDLFSRGLKSLRSNKKCLKETAFYQLLLFCIGGGAIALAYRGLHLQIGFLMGIVILVLNSFLSLVNITPGNFGIREAVFGYLSELSGLSFAQGVAASMLIRAVGLIITYSIAPIAWYLLFFRQNISVRLNENSSR